MGAIVNIHIYKIKNRNIKRLIKLLKINNIKKLTYIRGDFNNFKSENIKTARKIRKYIKIYFPLYPENHKETIKIKFEDFRNKRKKKISNNWITQTTYDIQAIITKVKKLKIKKKKIRIGIPLISKIKEIKKFNKICNIKTKKWFKREINSNFKKRKTKTKIIRNFIKTIMKLGFKKLQLFTLNKIKETKLINSFTNEKNKSYSNRR